MIHSVSGLASAPRDAELRATIAAHRLEAAKAFRVFRDAGVLSSIHRPEFVVRLHGHDAVAVYTHPGLWSVSLEPLVSVADLDGRLLSGPPAGEAARDLLPLLTRYSDVNVVLLAATPHLSAWARGGLELLDGAERLRVRSGDIELAPFEGAVLRPEGQAVLWSSGGVPDVSERLLRLDEVARIEQLARSFGFLSAASSATPARIAV